MDLSLEATEAPTRQQLRAADRSAHKERTRQARINAREMQKRVNRIKHQPRPVPPFRKPAREWARCFKCGHIASPWGFINRHHCPAVAS